MSETNPKTGLAEIPEKPSEPPHSNPKVSLLMDAGLRLILFASIRPTNVFLIHSAKYSSSELLFFAAP